MPNKINGLETRPIRVSGAASVPRTGQRGADAASGGAEGSAEPDVRITGTARSLAALEARVRDLPAIDAARVAEVQQRLDEGRYSVDPQRIADRLLRLEGDLAPARPRPFER